MTHADQIRYALRKTGRTRKSLAPLAGVSERTTAAAARGANVEADTLDALAKGLGWSWRLLAPEEAALIDGLRVVHEDPKKATRLLRKARRRKALT